MRAVYWLTAAAVALGLALFVASNREAVALGLWPLPFLVEIPLYLAVLAALLLGFVVGALAAWVGGRRRRREVRRQRRRIAALERELAATQAELGAPPLPQIPQTGRSLPISRSTAAAEGRS